jgi:hypothetical protein
MEMTIQPLNGMLPCPVKTWWGIDCPGCGFQRAFFALLQGDLSESWHHYPALIPFLVTMVLVPVAVKTQWPYRKWALWGALAVTCTFITTHYVIKMW